MTCFVLRSFMKLVRASWIIGIVFILLVGVVVPIEFGVEGASSQSQSTQLQTLIQVAISSRNYAITIVDLAQSQGLNVASSEALLASGNSSLAIAQSDLSTNSNLTVGIQLVHSAMSDFTNASASASISLQNSKTDAFLQIAESLDSINAANGTANTDQFGHHASMYNKSYEFELTIHNSRGIVFPEGVTSDLQRQISGRHLFCSQFRNNPIGVNNQSSTEFDCGCEWEHFPSCHDYFATRSVFIRAKGSAIHRRAFRAVSDHGK